MIRRPPRSTLFPTRRSSDLRVWPALVAALVDIPRPSGRHPRSHLPHKLKRLRGATSQSRSEEHTSELQSQSNLVCRLLLEKKKKNTTILLEDLQIQMKNAHS